MTPVSDSTTANEFLRLRVQTQFATHHHEEFGELLIRCRERMARELAVKILEQVKFFDLNVTQGYGTMRSDVVVMTEQELADFSLMKFRNGVKHAQGFVSLEAA